MIKNGIHKPRLIFNNLIFNLVGTSKSKKRITERAENFRNKGFIVRISHKENINTNFNYAFYTRVSRWSKEKILKDLLLKYYLFILNWYLLNIYLEFLVLVNR